MNIVYVPCKDVIEAKKIARELTTQKLAVCINIISPIESVYLWQGKVKECCEALLIIKTTQKFVDQVISQIKKLHSYKLPDIISWKIDKTTPQVEKWSYMELK